MDISKTGTTLINDYVGMLPVGLADYMRGEVEQFPAVYAKLSTLDKFYVGMAMAAAITAPWTYTLIRFFIGCAGATFVTNQFWCSLMFALNVVGTAIDTAAGQATMPSLHAPYSTRWVFSGSSTLPITTNRAELGPKSQHRGNKRNRPGKAEGYHRARYDDGSLNRKKFLSQHGRGEKHAGRDYNDNAWLFETKPSAEPLPEHRERDSPNICSTMPKSNEPMCPCEARPPGLR